jgi:hypothetical protein
MAAPLVLHIDPVREPTRARRIWESHLRLGGSQDWRVKPFGEPAVDGCEKLAGLGALALVAPEARSRTARTSQISRSTRACSRYWARATTFLALDPATTVLPEPKSIMAEVLEERHRPNLDAFTYSCIATCIRILEGAVAEEACAAVRFGFVSFE